MTETLLKSAFLPHDLVGGSIPYLKGRESDSVWIAATQACGTENVHYCYTLRGGRAWYLACPSASLSSAPQGSWCPLASALPGGNLFYDQETVYVFEQDGLAAALKWDADSGRLRVFSGAARTILPRMQALDSTIFTIDPALAIPVVWHNKTLSSQRRARHRALMALWSAALMLFLAAIFLILQ